MKKRKWAEHLADGTLISPRDLRFHHHENFVFTQQNLKDVALAWSVCHELPSKAVVLALNNRILGIAYGFESDYDACAQATEQLRKMYKALHWYEPDGGVVAVTTYLPRMGDVLLQGAGVDILFFLEHDTDPEWPLTEERLIRSWFNSYTYDPKTHKQVLAPTPRAVIHYPYDATEEKRKKMDEKYKPAAD